MAGKEKAEDKAEEGKKRRPATARAGTKEKAKETNEEAPKKRNDRRRRGRRRAPPARGRREGEPGERRKRERSDARARRGGRTGGEGAVRQRRRTGREGNTIQIVMRRDERRRESKPRERRTVVNGSRRHREGDAKVVYRYTPTGTRFRLERAPRLGVRTALLSAVSRRREVYVGAFRDGHHARLPVAARPLASSDSAPPSRTILEISSKTATSLVSPPASPPPPPPRRAPPPPPPPPPPAAASGRVPEVVRHLRP